MDGKSKEPREFPDLSEEVIEWSKSWYNQYLFSNPKFAKNDRKINNIHNRLKSPNSRLKASEILDIISWGVPTNPRLFEENELQEVESVIKHIKIVENDSLKIHILRYLKGIGVPTASKILAIMESGDYSVFNRPSILILQKWNILRENNFQLTLDNWPQFLDTVRPLMREYNLNGLEFYRVCFTLYHRFYLDLPEYNYKALDNFF